MNNEYLVVGLVVLVALDALDGLGSLGIKFRTKLQLFFDTRKYFG